MVSPSWACYRPAVVLLFLVLSAQNPLTPFYSLDAFCSVWHFIGNPPSPGIHFIGPNVYKMHLKASNPTMKGIAIVMGGMNAAGTGQGGEHESLAQSLLPIAATDICCAITQGSIGRVCMICASAELFVQQSLKEVH